MSSTTKRGAILPTAKLIREGNGGPVPAAPKPATKPLPPISKKPLDEHWPDVRPTPGRQSHL
jgi:hypothetical protein